MTNMIQPEIFGCSLPVVDVRSTESTWLRVRHMIEDDRRGRQVQGDLAALDDGDLDATAFVQPVTATMIVLPG